MKIVILDGHSIKPGEFSWDELRALAVVEVFERTSESEIVSRTRDAEAVLTTRVPLSADTMNQLHEARIGK